MSGKRTSRTTARTLAELREDFKSFDRDDDDRINLLEFREFMLGLDSEISDDEVRIGFREIDSDHDGIITVHEFIAWWSEE